MPRGTLRTAAQIDVASPGGSLARAQPPDAQPDDGPARGMDSELERRFVPARQFQGCRFRSSKLPVSRRRKPSEGLAKGGQLERVARLARGASPSKKRWKAGRRRLGSWQAVSFTRGGGSGLDPTDITRADLQGRRRDPGGDEASEAKS